MATGAYTPSSRRIFLLLERDLSPSQLAGINWTEGRARAVRMVSDHAGGHPSRAAAICSIAAKIGRTPQTLNEWVKRAEVDSGARAGVPTDVAGRLKALEWENRELRQAWQCFDTMSTRPLVPGMDYQFHQSKRNPPFDDDKDADCASACSSYGGQAD
jgi:transposase